MGSAPAINCPTFTSQLYIIHTSHCRSPQRPAIFLVNSPPRHSFNKNILFITYCLYLAFSSIHGTLQYQDCTYVWYFYPVRQSLFQRHLPCKYLVVKLHPSPPPNLVLIPSSPKTYNPHHQPLFVDNLPPLQ